MHERVLFIALIFSAAYALKAVGVFRREHSEILVDYVVYFCLPVLVFREMRRLEPDPEALGVVLTAWGTILTSLLISFLTGRFFSLKGGSMRAFLLVSSFGNTAFLGYPFAFAFFGSEGLTYAVLYDQLGSFLMVVSLGFLIASGKVSARQIFSFPPFPALLVGLASRGVPLPAGTDLFLDSVSASLVPVVLFAVGLRFEPRELGASLKHAFIALLIKMFLAPLGVLLLIKALELKGTGYSVALLETAMPPMVMAGILALKYNLDERLALSAITLGIPLSFLTVPAFLKLLP